MPLRGIINKRIDDFFKEYDDLNDCDESEKFEIYSVYNIMKVYNIEIEDLLSGIIDGTDDYGIDAIYTLLDGRTINSVENIDDSFHDNSKIHIYIIQIKKEKGFKEKSIMKIRDGLENIFEIDEKLQGNEKFKNRANIIREIWTKWHESSNNIEIDINVFYVTIGDSKKINKKVERKEDRIIEFLKYIGFKNIMFKYIGEKEIFDMSSMEKYSKVIEAIDFIEYDEEQNQNVKGFLLLVKGEDFLKFIVNEDKSIDDKIFELNVRDYQGKEKEVNSNIKNTLQNDNRLNFWCMNNGISILSTKITRRVKKFNLNDYYIINGCQTSHAIWETYKDKNIVEDFEIFVKLIETNNANVALDIIQATNSSIPIDHSALVSNEPIHKAIEMYFQNGKKQLFYERRRNFYKRRKYPLNKIINPQKLFQIVKSVYDKHPGIARGNPKISFKKEHDSFFNIDYYFEYYKYATLLYLKAISLNKKFKKKHKLNNEALELINNGQFHLTRIMMALINNSDSRINLKDNKNAIVSSYNDKINEINEIDINNDIFINSHKLLYVSLVNYIKNEEDTSISNILKSKKFDNEYLSIYVKRFLKYGSMPHDD